MSRRGIERGLTPLDRFAELLARDMTIADICREMGISTNQGQKLLKLLRRTMGWQAK